MSIVETARNAVKAAAETALQNPAVQKVTGRGETESAGPVTLTIAVDVPTARAFWTDPPQVSRGLGDIAYRYGYQRFDTAVMVAVIAVLIVLVCGIQWLGDRLVACIDKRH